MSNYHSRNERGRRGRGGYQGGSRNENWRSANANITRDIPIPAGAEGIIIGSRGSNIKELQALPGIKFVNLRNGQLSIGGDDAESVAVVEFRVREKLNKLLNGPQRDLRQIHYDMEQNATLVEFLPILRGGLVSFAHQGLLQAAGHDLHTLRPVILSLEEQFGNLAVTTGNFPYRAKNVSRLVRNPDVIVQDFKSVLGEPNFPDIKIEVRFSGTAFHHISSSMHGTKMPVHRILEDYQDYRTQFSVALNIPCAALQQALEKAGFDNIGQDTCTVVHIEDPILRTGYKAKFIEDHTDPVTEESTDSRLTEEKRLELERISKCSGPNEILQVSASPKKSDVLKAYKKKHMLVHPDKNCFPGATEAAKFVGMGKADLLDSRKNHDYEPPLFETGSSNTNQLPKLIELSDKKGKAKHLLFDTIKVKAEDAIGTRLEIATKELAKNPPLVEFLEKAWRDGEIKTGGVLSIDKEYMVEAVRIKKNTYYSDGEYDIKLELVKQKATESLAQFSEFPEVSMKCGALEDAIDVLRENPGNSAQLDTVLQIFRDYVDRGEELAAIFSTISDRISE